MKPQSKFAVKPNRTQRRYANGYEQGSVASRFTPQQRRAYEEWAKRKREDAAAYERQLSRQN